MLNRRQFLGGAAAAAWIAQPRAVEANGSYTTARYGKAIVIDACGSVGEYDPTLADDAPLTARGLADDPPLGFTGRSHGRDKLSPANSFIVGR
jgi:hypothetical protein